MAEARVSIRMSFPLGVVIPTYNRADVLIRCLRHLEAQIWKNFEVVVVDDGSTDGTCRQIEEYAAYTSLSLRYVRQENSGPARARNYAVSLLKSQVCLLIGDDILVSPDFVQQHLTLHRYRPELQVVGLGLTRWNEDGQAVTPFMRWLDSGGFQFAYGDLLNGVSPTWQHFYTSNLSLKTEHLRKHPFDESFPTAAMEDMELGYRMEMRGALEVVFLPTAVAEHLHPTSIPQACRRMIGVGSAAYRFHRLWPEHHQPGSSSAFKQRLRSILMNEHWVLPALRGAAGWLTQFWCPNPLLKRVLLLHYALGYRKAAGRLASSPSNG